MIWEAGNIFCLLIESIHFKKANVNLYVAFKVSLNIDCSPYHMCILDYAAEREDCALYLSSCKDKNNKRLEGSHSFR